MCKSKGIWYSVQLSSAVTVTGFSEYGVPDSSKEAT